MRIFQSTNNTATIMMMYSAVVRAPELEIRGMKCRNISDAAMILDGRIPPLTSFRARNMNLAYAKREWLWYLGADKMDDSIMEHAKMWAKLKQEDGSFYSNYGQYIFDTPKKSISQFEYVIKCLKADKFTRRAVIVLLQPHHLYLENTDVVCTYDINFSIEGDYLNMMVMMRSNDAVFGFTNDAFCFWNLMEFVYQIMSTHYPNLQRGYYTHFTNSMHVYERHYKMLQDIVMVPSGDYKSINVPRPTPQEVVDLVKTKGKGGKGEYTTWLSTFD